MLHKTKSDEANNIYKSIVNDETSISASKTTIASLKITIDYTRRVLQAYKLNLTAIQEANRRLEDILPVPVLEMAAPSEAGSFQICERVIQFIESNTKNETDPLQRRKEDLEAKITDLSSMLAGLEAELLDWRIHLALNEESIQHFRACLIKLLPLLAGIKRMLSPIRQVPDDVWLRVFWSVHDSNAYHRPPNRSSFHMLSVSQVCRRWRTLTLSIPIFWEHIDIVPLSWWPDEDHYMFNNFFARTPPNSVTFVYRMWLKRPWESALVSGKDGKLDIHREKISHQSILGSTGATQQHLQRAMFPSNPKPYSLHLYINYGPAKSYSGLPFRTTNSISIQASPPGPSGRFAEIASAFTTIKQLTIVDVWPSIPILAPLYLPCLVSLTLRIRSFREFDIAPLLRATLEELHIWHDGNRTFKQLGFSVRLPQLHTLSATPYEFKILPMSDIPSLRTLNVHAPPENAQNIPSIDATDSFKTIERVKIDGWSHQTDSGGFVDIIASVAGQASRLLQLEFDNCRIDGPRLLSLINKDRGKPQSGALKIEQIDLYRCTGITQTECEELKSYVERLNVYV